MPWPLKRLLLRKCSGPTNPNTQTTPGPLPDRELEKSQRPSLLSGLPNLHQSLCLSAAQIQMSRLALSPDIEAFCPILPEKYAEIRLASVQAGRRIGLLPIEHTAGPIHLRLPAIPQSQKCKPPSFEPVRDQPYNTPPLSITSSGYVEQLNTIWPVCTFRMSKKIECIFNPFDGDGARFMQRGAWFSAVMTRRLLVFLFGRDCPYGRRLVAMQQYKRLIPDWNFGGIIGV